VSGEIEEYVLETWKELVPEDNVEVVEDRRKKV
jgi:hypothetical protein